MPALSCGRTCRHTILTPKLCVAAVQLLPWRSKSFDGFPSRRLLLLSQLKLATEDLPQLVLQGAFLTYTNPGPKELAIPGTRGMSARRRVRSGRRVCDGSQMACARVPCAGWGRRPWLKALSAVRRVCAAQCSRCL